MTWVKICGITNLEDALVAVEAGADAVGFVFYPASPRNVHPDLVRSIAENLPASVEKVGVFVSASSPGTDEKRRIIHEGELTGVQVHEFGSSSSSLRTLDELISLDSKLFIAWPAERIFSGRLGGFRWRQAAKGKVSAIFFDSGTSKLPGGTGKTFDWNKARSVLQKVDFPFVIAGGLRSENVAEAIETLRPWGVDVSSGVEARPGKKDPEKVRAFVRAVREADKKAS